MDFFVMIDYLVNVNHLPPLTKHMNNLIHGDRPLMAFHILECILTILRLYIALCMM
jgi:hypothetical protein